MDQAEIATPAVIAKEEESNTMTFIVYFTHAQNGQKMRNEFFIKKEDVEKSFAPNSTLMDLLYSLISKHKELNGCVRILAPPGLGYDTPITSIQTKEVFLAIE